VQTDAGTRVEQCTQVAVDQSTEWTQCMVSQTDQSVQAVCQQSLATVQVAPQTSDAVIQTLAVVAEPAETLSSAVYEDKLITESEIVGRYQDEEVASNRDNDIINSSFAAEPVMEIIEESPSHSDSASPGEQLQCQEDCSTCTPATRADVISDSDRSDTVAAQTAVTPATISALIEQLPNQYDADEIPQVPTVVQNHFPLATRASGTCRPAVLQPSVNMSTGTKYVYSLEQQTFLASSLMLQQSSDIKSLCCMGSQAASVQNIPIQQLVHEMPTLLSKKQALVTNSAAQTCACSVLNAKPLFTVSTTNPVEESVELGSSYSTITDATVALKPSMPALHAAEVCVSGSESSNQLSTSSLQRSTYTLCVDNGADKSHSAVVQEMTTKKLTSYALLPSVPLHNDFIKSESAVMKSANVSHSSHWSGHLESVANEPDQQCIRPVTRAIMGQTTDVTHAKFSADVLLEDDAGKSGSYKQDEKVMECENIAKQCDQSGAVESQSIGTCVQNNNASYVSSTEVTTACAGSRAKSEPYNVKEQKATRQTEMARLTDCTVTRGRNRRPLFVCKGPLMETVTTLESSDSTSPCHKVHKYSESGSRKLPVMLLGML